ncbi:helix-turn-helix transcriptional regulator [Streptomyces sp. NBC_00829]|uniref:helix-turn-helix transcriptional regulator n=1 Tax=Streptomyces sp. NBC_00829 TaxID=2903679 RepID=UPI0038662963|nr:helix-turn-helix domain-containing protein [Streptomyces sp. NBC_00829]
MTDNDTFRNWFRTTRKEAGLSQQKVADALQAEGYAFSQTTVAKIERGDRPLRLDEAAAIARLFGTTLDVALGLKPGDPNSLAARQLAGRTSLLQQIRAVIGAELDGAS